jgi:molybdenum cofactor cytidylyltransferase
MSGILPAQRPRERPRTVLVVLAAGGGTRFRSDPDATHKLLARLPADDDDPSSTVAERSIAHAVDAGVGPVVVVTGAVDLPLPPSVRGVDNPNWASGQMSSVRTGIEAAAAMGAGAVVVGLADQPGVRPEAWRAVAGHEGPIAVATYAGRRGNPVRLDEEVWDLLPAGGDEGARALMRARPELVREVACVGSPADIDTVEDLRRWQNS